VRAHTGSSGLGEESDPARFVFVNLEKRRRTQKSGLNLETLTVGMSRADRRNLRGLEYHT
jgi:hypothetical protein